MAIKVIVGEISQSAGTPAASYEKRIELGVEVKKVIGYYVLPILNGGLVPEQCRLSLANSAKTLFEPVGLGHLIVNQNVAIKDRFFTEEPFDVDGYVNARLAIPSPTTAPLLIQILFLVESTK